MNTMGTPASRSRLAIGLMRAITSSDACARPTPSHRPCCMSMTSRAVFMRGSWCGSGQAVGRQVQAGLGAADAADQADAFEHLRELGQAGGAQLGQQVPAAVGVVQLG